MASNKAARMPLAVPLPYHLRPMVLGDIPAVMAIDRVSFPASAPEQLFRNELVDNQLAHYQVLTRQGPEGEQIVGFAGFWLIADEIHVSTIAVAPDERGRGRGEWLFLNLLLLACDLHPLLMTLEVRRSNLAAQSLYTKYQFDLVGERRRYYRDTGEDALLMTVDLGQRPDYCAWLKEQAEQLADKTGAD